MLVTATAVVLDQRKWLKTKLVELFPPEYVVRAQVYACAFLCNVAQKSELCLLGWIRESSLKYSVELKHTEYRA